MILALVTAALLAAGVAAAEEPVARVSLDGDWAFAYTPSHENAVPPASGFRHTMAIPGCWDDRFDRDAARQAWPDARFNPNDRPIVFPMNNKPPDASLPYLVGTGWYRRGLEIPASWRGRQITLQLGRIVMEAWLYVNGRQVGHHFNHSAPWQVSLSPHLAWGKLNELVIAVDNTRTDRLGCDLRGWKGRSGGIFGSVALRTSGAARIADLFVWTNAGRLEWQTRLEGQLPPGAELQWRIADPAEKRTIDRGSQRADALQVGWQTSAEGLKPWSDEDPKLYELELELRARERLVDRCRQPFGRRRLTVHGTQLRLNGAPIFLRGICDSAYFPATCTLPTDIGWYREHFRRMKQVGFNWLRCHTWVPPEPYLQAADEVGMLIQVEPPTGYSLDQWREILVAGRRHPSVVIYCCGNEEMLDEPKIDVLRQCAAELRRSVPDGLFNPQEAMRGVEYTLSRDLAGLAKEPFLHHPGRLAALREFSDVFGQFTWGWLSYTSLQGEPEAIDQRLAVYQRPCLGHELGICGCYLDLERETDYQTLRIGPGLYRGAREHLRQMGLLERAPTYYRNSAAWQRLMLKDAMETARRSHLMAGYDCLGANDTHWHRTGYSCGVFDEFDRLKPGRTVNDVLSYNGPSVLLVDRQRERNLTWDTRFERDLSVSWFGARPLENAALQWTLRSTGGETVLSGRVPIARVTPGRVARIATVGGQLPGKDRAQKLTLSVELAGAGARIANEWDYWAFPERAPRTPEGLLVVEALDAQGLAKLADGARVVLFGRRPFPTLPMSFQMGLAGRPEGNLATVVAKHPAMEGFPHDGYCDWQFAKMFNGAAAIQCDGLQTPFEPIVEVVRSYKHLLKQAAVVEWRVGKGRLLVCSLALPAADPAANWLRTQFLAYAASDRFQPAHALSAERIAGLIGSRGASPKELPKTDEGLDPRAQLPRK